MQGSILIYGANRETRQNKVREYANYLLRNEISDTSENNPDVLAITKERGKSSIGIDKVRELISFLSEYPYQEDHKIVIIYTAESLTVPAQNALLKILEEPPAYALIILEAKSENSLLETVVSRCQRVAVKKIATSNAKDANSIGNVRSMDIGNRLTWAEEASKMERQDIVDFLEEWIDELRNDVEKNSYIIHTILKVSKDLEQTNVNIRLALEYLVLNMEE